MKTKAVNFTAFVIFVPDLKFIEATVLKYFVNRIIKTAALLDR